MFRAFAAVTFMLAAVEITAGTEVRLRSSAVCATSVIRVGDVAEVLGDTNVGGAILDVALCPAPAAGQQRTLTQEEVRRLLTLSGLERKLCTVTGSESVVVSSSATASGIRAKQPLIASGVRQAIFEADASAANPSRPIKPAPKEIPVPAEASVPPLVERGATVTVSARAAGVRITTSGKALEAGKAGDSINVELADSKQRILATVVGVQAVQVTDSSVAPAAVSKTN